MGTLRPRPWQSQNGFTYRFEWGRPAIEAIAQDVGAIVIVDVLRFGTAAAIAAEWGATIRPVDAPNSNSLDTSSMRAAAKAAAAGGSAILELWSENGAALAAAALPTATPVFAGALRNATATATAAKRAAGQAPIAIIGAGERWPDGTMRPATEDLLGAGAILRALDPNGSLTEPCCSPSARAARAAFIDAEPLLLDLLTATASGRELWERGAGDDVREASRLDLSTMAYPLTK